MFITLEISRPVLKKINCKDVKNQQKKLGKRLTVYSKSDSVYEVT